MAQFKRRTRGHVIAEIGVRYAEYVVAKAGYTSIAPPGGGDYGVDVYVFTYDPRGYPENGAVRLQVRSTESLRVGQDGSAPVRVDRRHLRSWLAEPYPVLLVVYDAAADRAVWVDVRKRFAGRPAGVAETVTIRCDADRSFDVECVRRAAAEKNAALARLGSPRYDDE